MHLILLNDTHTHTYTQTLDSIPTDEVSTSHSDLYLTTHNAHKRDTPMPRRDLNPNPNIHATTDPHLKQRGDRDRPGVLTQIKKKRKLLSTSCFAVIIIIIIIIITQS